MATTRKAFRLDDEMVSELGLRAEAEGVSEAEIVRRALTAYLDGTQDGTQDDEGGTQDGTRHDAASEAVRALTAQLEAKDVQISRLMDALTASQATVQAAQALHGAEMAGALRASGDDGQGASDAPRLGVWARFKRWLRS